MKTTTPTWIAISMIAIRMTERGVAQAHVDIGTRAIDAMSSVLKLKRNIYNLDYGFKPKDLTPPDPDPLAPIQYSCVFWADHLCSLSDNSRSLGELTDDGKVFAFLKECFLRWFWADHLCSQNSDNSRFLGELMDDGKVFGFLTEYFLRWLESLSLIGELSSGLLSIRKILHAAQVCC